MGCRVSCIGQRLEYHSWNNNWSKWSMLTITMLTITMITTITIAKSNNTKHSISNKKLSQYNK